MIIHEYKFLKTARPVCGLLFKLKFSFKKKIGKKISKFKTCQAWEPCPHNELVSMLQYPRLFIIISEMPYINYHQGCQYQCMYVHLLTVICITKLLYTKLLHAYQNRGQRGYIEINQTNINNRTGMPGNGKSNICTITVIKIRESDMVFIYGRALSRLSHGEGG